MSAVSDKFVVSTVVSVVDTELYATLGCSEHELYSIFMLAVNDVDLLLQA